MLSPSLIHHVNNASFLFFGSFANSKDVKKLSVVTFLPFSKYGSISCKTTLADNPWEDGRSSSFPR